MAEHAAEPTGKNNQRSDVEHTGDTAAVQQLRQHGVGKISLVAAPHGVEGGSQIHTGIANGDEDAEKRTADDGEDGIGLADQQAEHQQHGQGRDDADLEVFAESSEDGIELGCIGYAGALFEPDDCIQDDGNDVGGRNRVHHVADMPEQRNPADCGGHIGGIGRGESLSPKNAPQMMEAAVMPGSKPRPAPIPMMARPTVPNCTP